MADAPVNRSGHGTNAIYFAADENWSISALSPGFGPDGRRQCRMVSGKTKHAVRDKLKAVHTEFYAGPQSAGGYGARPLTSRFGARPLRKLAAADVPQALAGLSEQLSTRSLQIAYSYLMRGDPRGRRLAMRAFAQKSRSAQQATYTKSAILGSPHFRQSREVISILQLQRAIGNQDVQGLLQNNAVELSTWTASPHFGRDSGRIHTGHPTAGVMQTKLAINTPGDEYEQEADRTSVEVMRMPEPSAQRKCKECEETDRMATGAIRRMYAATSSPDSMLGQQTGENAPIDAPQIVSDVVSEPGHPLDPLVRSFMEPRFGYDFSQVRIHTGLRAAESARTANAAAYTVGHDVVFGEGAYRPESDAGRRLIAHELTHVIQQGSADTSIQPDSENEFGDSGALHADRGLQSCTSTHRRVQRQAACYCCVSSVAIGNIKRIDNATHMGHSYDLEIKMARSTETGPRLEPECTLEWWEKTNVPYTAGMTANTWTNMFKLVPGSPTLNPWNNRPTACGTNSTVTINDPPSLGKRPGRTVTRTLEFDLKVKSGPGGTCANSEKNATATQKLTMAAGAPDWANSSFA